MTNQQKTILFWIGTVLGAVAVVFLLVSINHTLNTATTSNTVAFTGEGKVMAKPDVARLNFSIVTQGTSSKNAQDANSAKSKEVTAFLKKQGIEDQDVKTSGYQIYPQQSYSPTGGTPRITGYQASQNFQITIRDLDNANKILDGVVSAGVNQVDQLQFDIDDPEELKAQAREKAIAAAKEKAKGLESQIDIDLGDIVNFQENVGGYPGPYYDKIQTGGGMGGGPSLPTGENEIVVSVTLTFQIK